MQALTHTQSSPTDSSNDCHPTMCRAQSKRPADTVLSDTEAAEQAAKKAKEQGLANAELETMDEEHPSEDSMDEEEADPYLL